MTTAPSSLLPRIEGAATGSGSVTFVAGERAERVPWARLHDDARRVAADLQARGVGPGSHVAFLGATSRELVASLQAALLCGATAVVLPLPMRLGSIEEFVGQTRARIRRADITLVVADPALLDFMTPEPGDPPVALLPDLGAGRRLDAYERPPDDGDALALLQFTSGSTAEPKGVMLPHRAVTANLDGIVRAARVDPASDVIVSWLPLYHDMGLIGTLLLPMTTGMDLVLGSPQDFMAAPRRWMEWMSEFGGTATAGPNFAYALATRALRRLDSLDLRRWRVALNGAEPVDPRAVDAFCQAGTRHGLDPRSAFPAFGMAEATLAVTFPEPGSGLMVDTVDRRVLELEGQALPTGANDEAKARRVALLGRPLHNLELRVTDPQTGVVLPERVAGELEIRGDSVTPGYYGDPAGTAAAFHNGWLRTGDLAYLTDGRLAVCGRIKDVIIVAGRNIFPEDAERAVASVEGVRAGNVIAFGVDGRRSTESLVVVAETKADADAKAAVRDAVARRVHDAVGVSAADVVLVAPGSLPKTSSGKLQRSLCRRWYEEGHLELPG